MSKCELCARGYDAVNDKHWVGGQQWQCDDPPKTPCWGGCGHEQYFGSSQVPCAKCGKTYEDFYPHGVTVRHYRYDP